MGGPNKRLAGHTQTHSRTLTCADRPTGINKFVILDIKKPDYSLIRQQLEQQQQAAYSASVQQNELIGAAGAQQSSFLDNNQNLAGDLAQYQSRIFGEYSFYLPFLPSSIVVSIPVHRLPAETPT